jgi:hypothetical protein
MAEVLAQAGDLLPGQDDGGWFQLSYAERIIGFGICSGCAVLAGFLAIVSLLILNLRKFAVLFTVSTLLFTVALGLLVGFSRLLKSCADGKRLFSSLGLGGGMFVTLFFGLFKRSILLAIAGFLVETVSFVYFALTFIPGGERLFHLLLF